MRLILTFFDYIMQCFFIILPVLISGSFFIFAIKKDYFALLKKPIDFHIKFRRKRIFGDNKTFRGFIIMPLGTFCSVVFINALFKALDTDMMTNLVFDYSLGNSYKSLIYGLSYSVGELPNSFIKRQINIDPGELAKNKNIKNIFSLIDRIDSPVFCCLVLLAIFKIDFYYAIGATILGIFFHFVSDVIMRKMNLKK